jgi:hypothetical protein
VAIDWDAAPLGLLETVTTGVSTTVTDAMAAVGDATVPVVVPLDSWKRM